MNRIAAAALSMAMLATPALAQTFPTKPVRTIIPYSAGSGPDTVMRLVGEKLARAWGQQLVVENRPGGNGWIAIAAAKQAPADGYTLLQLDDTHMALQPHIYKQLPHDLARDFAPVTPLYRTYFFIVVPVNSSWKSVTDLVAAAKAKPGALTYGSWGIGSVGHVGAAMLESATGTQMTHVPFKELPQLYSAVANGDVAWAFGTAHGLHRVGQEFEDAGEVGSGGHSATLAAAADRIGDTASTGLSRRVLQLSPRCGGRRVSR